MDEKEIKEISWLRDFLDRQEWIFAKTYADKAPHEYCLLRKVNGTKEDFLQAVKLIRKYGIGIRYYNTKEKKEYFYNDKLYWSMDDNPEDAVLINRCDCFKYTLNISWNGTK